jgi:hypothetical protein
LHINLDKLGSLDKSSNNLFFAGLEQFSGVEKIIKDSGFNKNDLPNLQSDATSFNSYNIPTIIISTEKNAAKNPLKDEVKMLNFEGEKKVITFIIKLIDMQEIFSQCICLKK